LNSSTRTAAAPVCDCANASGQNSPNSRPVVSTWRVPEGPVTGYISTWTKSAFQNVDSLRRQDGSGFNGWCGQAQM
jgi:hypothetical protein